MSEVLNRIVDEVNWEKEHLGTVLTPFGKEYGWRAGTQYVERRASVADVIRYETEDIGNDLTILAPMDFLATISASDAVWLTKTRREAREYCSEGSGDAYQWVLSSYAFIAASDNDGGYLVVDQGIHPMDRRD